MAAAKKIWPPLPQSFLKFSLISLQEENTGNYLLWFCTLNAPYDSQCAKTSKHCDALVNNYGNHKEKIKTKFNTI